MSFRQKIKFNKQQYLDALSYDPEYLSKVLPDEKIFHEVRQRRSIDNAVALREKIGAEFIALTYGFVHNSPSSETGRLSFSEQLRKLNRPFVILTPNSINRYLERNK